jgi:predicted MFS family arabinose efflux permease
MSRELNLLAISMATWGVGEGMFYFFQPLYLQKLGASPIEIGAILGGVGVSMSLAHIPAGYLADRVGRKQVLIAGWLIGLSSAWIMALAPSLLIFTIGLLTFSTTIFVLAPLYSYVTAARGKLSIGRTITLISASFNSGAVLGPIIGGQIGDQVGLRQVYVIAACIFAVSTLMVFFIRPQPVEARSEERTLNALQFDKRYSLYLSIVFLAVFAMYLPQSLSSNFLQNERGLSLGQIGQLGAISSLGVVVLNLVLGQLDARMGFILGQAAVGLFALLLWTGTGIPWFAAGYFLLGGNRTARSLASAHTREFVQQSNMGLAYGVTETVSSAAIILAAPLAGYLYSLHPIWMYPASLGLVMVSILVGAVFFISQSPNITPQYNHPTAYISEERIFPDAETEPMKGE